ncbi:hypothetical protein ACTXT7_002144 [Hymenolepis weldensis]
MTCSDYQMNEVSGMPKLHSTRFINRRSGVRRRKLRESGAEPGTSAAIRGCSSSIVKDDPLCIPKITLCSHPL